MDILANFPARNFRTQYISGKENPDLSQRGICGEEQKVKLIMSPTMATTMSSFDCRMNCGFHKVG